jgi:hypothetical protein
MASYPTSHYFALGQRLQDLYWQHYSDLLAKYPANRYPNDVRPALFGLSGNALVGYIIAMHVVETTLSDKAWWTAHTPYRTESEILERFQHYERTMRQAYFVIFVSQFEWAIRNLLAVVDPSACDGGLSEYKSVYDALLARIDRRDLTTAFDISRHLRNLLHNNGVYCSRKRTNSPVYEYRSTRVQFFHGKTVDMATEMSFQVMEDLILAARAIVDSPVVAALDTAPFTLTTGEKADPRRADA